MEDDEFDDLGVIDLVWPAGIPESDRVVLEALLPETKARTLRRLSAVWRAEQGEDWRPLAKSIGLSRAGFYNLRKAWRELSLAGVIPHGTRTPRRVRSAPGSPMRDAARELLIADGLRRRNIDIARSLLEQDPHSPEIGGNNDQTRRQWAVRLIRHERAALARNPDYQAANFGRRLAIDLSAVSIAIEGEAELAVAAVCIDVASSLILGSSLGRLQSAVWLQREAIAGARHFLSDRSADRSPSSWPKCDLNLMLPPEMSKFRDNEAIKASTTTLNLRAAGSYAFGQEIVQMIGPRIGRLSITPRKTLAIATDGLQAARRSLSLTPEAARARWDGEVYRHNRPILKAMELAGIFGNGVSEGRIAAALAAVDEALLLSSEHQPPVMRPA